MMMMIADIVELPDTVKCGDHGSDMIHESTLRSYHVLAKVKYWLNEGMKPDLVLSLIDEIDYLVTKKNQQEGE